MRINLKPTKLQAGVVAGIFVLTGMAVFWRLSLGQGNVCSNTIAYVNEDGRTVTLVLGQKTVTTLASQVAGNGLALASDCSVAYQSFLSKSNGKTEVYKVPINKGVPSTAELFTTLELPLSRLRLSSDNKKLYVEQNKSEKLPYPTTRVIDLATKKLSDVIQVDSNFLISSFVESTDGRSGYFSGRTKGDKTQKIYKVDLIGKKWEAITNPSTTSNERDVSVDISTDNKYLAITRATADAPSLVRITSKVVVLELKTGQQKQEYVQSAMPTWINERKLVMLQQADKSQPRWVEADIGSKKSKATSVGNTSLMQIISSRGSMR